MCGSYGAGSEKKHVFTGLSVVSDVGWKHNGDFQRLAALGQTC